MSPPSSPHPIYLVLVEQCHSPKCAPLSQSSLSIMTCCPSSFHSHGRTCRGPARAKMPMNLHSLALNAEFRDLRRGKRRALSSRSSIPKLKHMPGPSAKTETINRLTREGQGHQCTGGLGSVWKMHKDIFKGLPLYFLEERAWLMWL